MDEPTPALAVVETPANEEFLAVAEAAREAAYTEAALQAVIARHDAALSRLADSLAVVGFGPDLARPDGDDHVHQVLTVDVSGPPPAPAPETVDEVPEPPTKASRQPGRHAAHPGEAAEKAERAARVSEAVARHGGDRTAAAAELGMRPNAVAMVMKFADRRAGDTA